MNRNNQFQVLILLVVAVVAIGYLIELIPNGDLATTLRQEVVEINLEPLFQLGTQDTVAGKPPSGIQLSFNQGTLALQQLEYESAIKAFTAALAIQPDLNAARVNLGFARLGMLQFQAARDQFDLARERDPLIANVYYGTALVHEHNQELAEAILAMQTFRHLAGVDHSFFRPASSAIAKWQQQIEDQGISD